MVMVLIFVRIEKDILDYRFYSRELSPLYVDNHELKIVYLKEKRSDYTDIALLKLKFIDFACAPLDKLPNAVENNNDKTNNNNSITPQPSPVFEITATKLLPQKWATVNIEAHLASCVVCEISRSRKFRRKFIKQVKRWYGFATVYDPRGQLEEREYDCVFDSEIWLRGVIEIVPHYSRQKIDYSWCYRMEGQVAKRVILEETMAWLSTLGGGYSSLGDYFQYHAEEAGKISFKQLRIAIELGDPIIASRCRLFFAQSLMQRGYLTQSRNILRLELKFTRSLPVIDEKLLSICKFLRKRLHYLQSLSKHPTTKENLVLIAKN